MLPPYDYVAFKDYDLNRLPSVLTKARQHVLLSEAGLAGRPWVSCQVCRSLRGLGRLFIRAGAWLERRYTPPALAQR